MRDRGIDTVLFGNSVLAADVAAGLAARLDAGLNWDLTDLVEQDGKLVGKRPALQDSVYVRQAWLDQGSNKDIAIKFLRASFRGWMFCRDNQAKCIQYTVDAGSTLPAGHGGPHPGVQQFLDLLDDFRIRRIDVFLIEVEVLEDRDRLRIVPRQERASCSTVSAKSSL